MHLDLEGLLPYWVEGVARYHLGFVLAAVSGNANDLSKEYRVIIYVQIIYVLKSILLLNTLPVTYDGIYSVHVTRMTCWITVITDKLRL